MRGWMAVALVGLMAGTPALAQDRSGYRAIAAGDYDMAAQRLEQERRIFPQRPELMLNLAAAYLQMNRVADARALYRQVQAAPAIGMDMADGSVVSSHTVAARGLARLPASGEAIAVR